MSHVFIKKALTYFDEYEVLAWRLMKNYFSLSSYNVLSDKRNNDRQSTYITHLNTAHVRSSIKASRNIYIQLFSKFHYENTVRHLHYQNFFEAPAALCAFCLPRPLSLVRRILRRAC